MEKLIQNTNGKKELEINLIFVEYGADSAKELPKLNIDAIRRI